MLNTQKGDIMRAQSIYSNRIEVLLVYIVALILVSTVFTVSVYAKTTTWTDNAPNNYWSYGDNWNSGRPFRSDKARFSSNGYTGTDVARNNIRNLELRSILFVGSGAGNVLTNGQKIKLSAGITNNNTGTSLTYVDNAIEATRPINIITNHDASMGFYKPFILKKHNLTFKNGSYGFTYLDNVINGHGLVSIKQSSTLLSRGGVYLSSRAVIKPRVVVNNWGILNGKGRVNKLTIGKFGEFRPDGCFKSGNLSLLSFSFYYADLGGAKPCKHDRAIVRGAVRIGKYARLNIRVPNDSNLRRGQRFMVINNDGRDSIKGRFAGKKEGKIVHSGLYRFRITYKGGTGNDVVLKLLN